jgi:hypothetical protein
MRGAGHITGSQQQQVKEVTVNVSKDAGDILSWGVDGAEVSEAKVRDSLAAAGLPHKALKPLSPKVAFSRTVKPLEDEGILVEKVSRKGKVILYQFTDEANDGNSIRHSEKCFVTLDVYSAATTSTDPGIGAMVEAGMRLQLSRRTNQDITYLVQKLFKNNADLFPINRSKGVAYFMPYKHAEFADKVEKFLDEVGGYLDRWPVPEGTRRGGKAITKAVRGGLDQLLDDLEYAVKLFDEDTRRGTVNRKTTDYEVAKAKIEAYGQFLAGSQSELLLRAEKIKEKLRKKLEELTE